MKKNFFKKLSFVLALAMIISTVAPAAIGYAASAPKLNATKKYLHLDVDGKDNYNFNVANKKSGWVYSWESTDEDVAVVDERGVATATGVGSAQITCLITDKKGVEQATLTATVTVRDNIKSLTITGTPADNKLAIGKANTFTYTYTTNANKTSGSGSVVTWKVEPADGATITDKGEFVATKAGKYTVKASAYQSADRAKAADANYLTATATYDVTVAASMVSAKQVDKDTVNVTFDAAMTDVAKNLSLYQVVGSTKVAVIVSEVKMDAANKVAAVSTYVPFTAGASYVVDYTGLTAVSFTAATSNAEDVAYIQVASKNATVGTATSVDVTLSNKDGVDITTPTLLARVTYSAANEVNTWYDDSQKQVTIFAKGVTATIKATYHTYKFNATTGAEEGNLEAAGVLTGVDPAATNLNGLAAYTIAVGAPNWNSVNRNLAAEDSNYQLFVKYNTLTGTTTGTVDSVNNAANFEFVSSDEGTLIVNPATGLLYPVKAGTAVVVVKYNADSNATKAPIDAITVTIGAKRAAASLSLDATNFSLSNTVAVADTKAVKITLKDQFTVDFPFAGYTITKLSGPASDLLAADVPGDDTISFAAVNGGVGALKGTYVYKVTVSGLSTVVYVNVLESTDANNAPPAYYKLSLSGTSFDLKAESGKTDKSLTVDVFGYSSNGVKVTKETINPASVDVAIDGPTVNNTEPYDLNFTNGQSTLSLAAAVSGGAMTKAPVGTYKVTLSVLKNGNLVPRDVATFTVTDTQSKPIFASVTSRVFSNTIADANVTDPDDAQLVAAAKACFKITLDGTEVTSNIVGVNAIGTGNSVSVKSVVVRQTIDNTYIDHTVTINMTINHQ